jgi:hypothetical protein
MFRAVIGYTLPEKLSRTFCANLAKEVYLLLVFELVDAVDGPLFPYKSALRDLVLLLRLEVAVFVYPKVGLVLIGFIFSWLFNPYKLLFLEAFFA